jgi:hypothetical protein
MIVRFSSYSLFSLTPRALQTASKTLELVLALLVELLRVPLWSWQRPSVSRCSSRSAPPTVTHESHLE